MVEPYLFFGGRCEEALEFYKGAIGAKVLYLIRYKESPEKLPVGMLAPEYEDKVMHSTISVGGSQFMMSDGCGEKLNFAGFSLSLAVPDKAVAEKVFAALAVGGAVKMPLTKTFWSPCFGMLTDKFGMGWMISVEA